MAEIGKPASADQVQAKALPPRRRRRAAASRWTWSNFKDKWPIWLVAGTTLISGAMSVLQMAFTQLQWNRGLYSWALPYGLPYWGRSLSIIFGFLLVYLSLMLFQRRRIAWWLATFSSGLLVVAHILEGSLWYLAVAPSVAFVLLLVFRRRFSVRSEPTSVKRGLELMTASILVALVYGTLGFWLLHRSDFGIEFSFTDSIVRTLRQFILIGNTDLTAHSRHARWFLESLSALGVVALGFAAYSLFRPVAFRLQVLPHEDSLAKAILERHGHSPYDFFKVWPDKTHFFSESKNSFIAYATVRGVALVLGDPVGPDDELEELTSNFLNHCTHNGWLVCFLLPDMLEMYERLGLHLLKIGEEAVVDLEHFSSHTSNRRYFRYHRGRFERRGYKVVRYVPPHSQELLQEIEEVETRWLKLPKHRELGFLQGRFERSYVEKSPLCVVRDSDEHIIAFVNEVPSYREGEATFDMMRHLPESPNGTMDYLFQGLMLILHKEGYQTFNLGVAPFAGVGKRPGAPRTEKVLQILFRINWFVSVRGMHYYKVKFEPRWEDRFAAYTGGPISLVRIALAVTRAVEGRTQ